VSGATFELEADNEGSDFYFDPTVLKSSPGAKVTLTVKNEGSTLHDFTIEDQNLDEDVKPDEEVTVTVTFPQSGVVEFHCEYHQGRGMVGELTV
jgi:plastocyanin